MSTANDMRNLERNWRPSIPLWVQPFLFAGAYYAAAELSRLLSLGSGPLITLWMPSGLYLAVLLRSEIRQWPFLVLAAVAANTAFDLQHDVPLAMCLGYVAANSLEALVGALLIRHLVGPSFTLTRIRHLMTLVVVTALCSTPLGATVGSVSLALTTGAPFLPVWVLWWCGDAVGVVVVLPVVLALFPDEQAIAFVKMTPARMIEGTFALGTMIVCAQYVFGSTPYSLPLPMVLIPPLLWLAVRFGWRGVATAVFISALIAIINTKQGFGPFFGDHLPAATQVFRVQAFLSISGLAFLILDAVIHERRRIEDALRESDARFHAFMDNSPVVAFLLDPDWRLLYANKPYFHLFDLSPQVLGRRADYFAPEFSSQYQKNFLAALKGGKAVEAVETFPRRDGSVGYGLVYKFPFRDASGRLLMGGVGIDITERTKLEQMVKASEHMLATVLNNVPQGVFWKDRDSRYLGCNAVVSRAHGLESPNQILGKTDRDLTGLTDEQADFFVQKDREVMNSGVPMLGIIEQATMADGTTVWLETNKMPLRDAQGQVVGVLGTWQDITERKQLEEQLRQAQRMEAVGQLAGGVAHDFNNLLTVINGYADLMMYSLPPDSHLRTEVEQIRNAGERAASLTNQLLAFSRKQVLQPRILDLNSVIAESAKMLRRVIGEDIDLSVLCGPNIAPVKADRGQIEQVMLNLAINARDAMPKGGKLTIETTNIELDEAYCEVHPEARPGRFVQVSMSDTGCGMTPEIRARIFEPYFTTKEIGKGTGLGLAVVHGIVKQSGGRIEVYSEPGIGTSFKLYLPAVAGAAGNHLQDRLPAAAAHGTETVLLVEDESGVREIALLALETHGYRVLTASSGKDALQVAQQHPGTIHLLVTDLIMPGMSGRELAENLGPQFPGLRTLFVSGYTDDAVIRHGLAHESVAFLQKPFAPIDLARKVRAVLDEE